MSLAVHSTLLVALLCLAACSDDSTVLDRSEASADGGQLPAVEARPRAREPSVDAGRAAAAPALPSPPARDAALSPPPDAGTSAHTAHPRDAASLDASAHRDSAVLDARTARPPAKDAGEPNASSPPDAALLPSVPCDEQLSYQSFGKPFLDTYCISCHGFKNEPLFTSLDKVEPYASEIIERVLYETIDALHMPPYGRPQPSASEQKQLESWLSCGPQ